MSKEKPDEFLSWRGRLHQPEALPEQALEDREASWERLAERLGEKPRRRTAYWIAAACLLLALAPVAHLFHDRRPPLVLHSPVRPQTRPEKVAAASGKPPAPGRTPAQAPGAAPAPGTAPAPDKAMGSRTLEASRNIGTPPPARSFHRSATPSLASVPLAGVHPLAGPEKHPPSIAQPMILPPTDTANRLIAQRPAPKKTLRIISINEINKEGVTPAMSTGRAGFFHIGDAILRNRSLPDPASRQDQDKDYILKINLSSSSQNR
jgi:hypothetical protein